MIALFTRVSGEPGPGQEERLRARALACGLHRVEVHCLHGSLAAGGSERQLRVRAERQLRAEPPSIGPSHQSYEGELSRQVPSLNGSRTLSERSIIVFLMRV